MNRPLSKQVKLKDGSPVLIREMTPEDIDRSYKFFLEIPEEDRLYLRRDVTDRDLVEERIRESGRHGVMRIVATAGDEIVADGALELSPRGWEEHVGELRLIVARPYQRKGLGILMARELYGMAAAAKVDEVVVRMMSPQKAARSIFHKLGFREEAVLPEYARDRTGRKQDMILMRRDLKALWEELESFLTYGDWQRTR